MEHLDCVIQDYAWGDPTAIPSLLGTESTGTPAAELWMGAHPKAPSFATSSSMPLDELIAAQPEKLLGVPVNDRFGKLPFLFKILAAAQPLSIQSHPNVDQARQGFRRENDQGVELDSPLRTYRDDNHKPELICALTPFAAKVGFRALDASRALFAALGGDALGALREQLDQTGDEGEVLQRVLEWLLRLPADEATTLVRATVAAAATCGDDRYAPELAWVPRVQAAFPDDIGGVVALLLNHVELLPGDAVFLGAGNLHAYLQGTGVELMANSDNVVRGGLTPKNIDVDELLSVVDATPLDPVVQQPADVDHTYDSPVPEFSLTRIATVGPAADSEEAIMLDGTGPRIAIVTEGSFRLAAQSQELAAKKGQAVFIGDDDGPIRVSGVGAMFVASVGNLNQH